MSYTLKDVFLEYESLIENDSTDYIKAVSNLVKTTNTEQFEKTFKQWLIDSIGNIYCEGKNTNPKCIILCGDNDSHGNVFGALLLPVSYSSEYLFRFDKDFLKELSESFIIVLNNLDEIIISHKNAEKLKALLSLDRVVYRPLYSDRKASYPRVSNFIGTTTNLKSSEIGQGRFLVPFDLIEPIDLDALRGFDIRKMWGQAHKIARRKSVKLQA